MRSFLAQSTPILGDIPVQNVNPDADAEIHFVPKPGSPGPRVRRPEAECCGKTKE